MPGAVLALLAACEYPYFLKTQFNDTQLSCEEIDQQVAETQKAIDRRFLEEYGPLTGGIAGGIVVGGAVPIGRELNNDRRASRASAIERQKVLLSLRAQKCDNAASPANRLFQDGPSGAALRAVPPAAEQQRYTSQRRPC
jgi:hypothetical protein